MSDASTTETANALQGRIEVLRERVDHFIAAYDGEHARVAVLEAALRDECEMNEQSLPTLRGLLAHWERLGEERTFDGEPVIEEELRGLIDDLDTSSARALLAGGDAAPPSPLPCVCEPGFRHEGPGSR